MTRAETPSPSSAFGPLDESRLLLSLEVLRLLEHRCHTPEPTPPVDDDEDEEDDDRGSTGGNIDPDDEEGDFDDEEDDDDETLWTLPPARFACRHDSGGTLESKVRFRPRLVTGRAPIGFRDGYR